MSSEFGALGSLTPPDDTVTPLTCDHFALLIAVVGKLSLNGRTTDGCESAGTTGSWLFL